MPFFFTNQVRAAMHALKIIIEVYKHITSQTLTQAKSMCINYHKKRAVFFAATFFSSLLSSSSYSMAVICEMPKTNAILSCF